MEDVDNLAVAGTETIQDDSLTIEQAMDIDFVDSDDELEGQPVAEEAVEGEETEDGQELEEEGQEQEENAENEEEAPQEEAEKPEPQDDVFVTVNGEKVAVSELKNGYLRQSDYTRKTQEVAETRKNLEALSQRVNQSVSVVADYLASKLPQEPNANLLYTGRTEDTQLYLQQKAIHDNAVHEMNQVLSAAGGAQQVSNELINQQREQIRTSELAKLADTFPETKTQEGKERFFQEASQGALGIGFTQDEISNELDSRLFILAHWAKKGMDAEKAKEKAIQKVAKAPPVAPVKRQAGVDAGSTARQKTAIDRHKKLGTVAAAMAVDWD